MKSWRRERTKRKCMPFSTETDFPLFGAGGMRNAGAGFEKTEQNCDSLFRFFYSCKVFNFFLDFPFPAGIVSSRKQTILKNGILRRIDAARIMMNGGWTMRHEIRVTLFFAVLFCVCFTGCEKKESAAQEEKFLPVRFYKLSQRPLGRYRMFPGIIRPEEQVNLSFRVDGRLIQFNAGSGKRFKKGDLLAKLDPAVFQAAVDSAEAKYQEALKDYERYKTLYGKKVVAATEYEKKKRDLDMSEAALRNAREDLRYSEIYAPFSGVTSTTYADTYQHIKANEPLIRLQNLDALQVSIDVPEKDFSVGIPNNITEVNRLAEENGGFYGTVPALPGQRFKLSLKETSTEADSVTQTFRVTFRIAGMKNIRLFPGMTMAVYVPDLQHRTEAERNRTMFDVPFGALFTKDGESCVWLIGADGRVRAVPVKTGAAYESVISITSPQLKPGDMIAASGVMVLHDGDRVRELPETGSRKTLGH